MDSMFSIVIYSISWLIQAFDNQLMIMEGTQPVALKFYVILSLADRPSLSLWLFTLTIIILIKINSQLWEL